jgi:hypothetical protein
MQQNWSNIFAALGIGCPKVTHQLHVQTQQRLSDKGCSTQNIDRAIGYAPDGMKMNGNCRTSYLNCSPVQFFVGAADGNPNDPGAHSAGWNVEIFWNEIEMLVPYLYQVLDAVEKAYYSSTNHKERKTGCLNQALGSLKATERRIHNAVKLLASKVPDDRNNLLAEEPAIYLRWQTPVLLHDFFASEEFCVIVKRVQGGQIRESLNDNEEPSPLQLNCI